MDLGAHGARSLTVEPPLSAILFYLLVTTLGAAALALSLFFRERKARLRLHKNVAALREKANTFQLVAENASDGLLLQHLDSRILWANSAYCDIMGYEADEIVGRYPLEFVMPPDLAVDKATARSYRFDENMHEFEGLVVRRNVRKNGEEFFNQLNLSMVEVRSEGADSQLIVASCRDVTEDVHQEQELRQAHEDLIKLARFDGMTGLANRGWFGELLEQALLEATSQGRRVALCQVDLDRFKEINDSLGHAAGDAALKHVAAALEAHQSDLITAARVGGDEFCFFVLDPPELDELADHARLLQHEISRPLTWEAGTITPSATIGIAVSTEGETDVDALSKRADFALYAAKENRRGTVGVFDSDLMQKYERHRRIRVDLAHAIDNGGLIYNFQPIVHCNRESAIDLETLVRWTHPEYGPIAPDVFLPLAREMGRMPEVDFFGARAALRLLADLDKEGFEGIGAGINVSPETLVDSMFLDFVLWEAERNGIDHRRLRLEILETVFFATNGKTDESADAVGKLKAEGFTVLLDDFGVGHAGLSHLANLQVDGIKIDRSLIAPLPGDPQSLVIVESIVALAEKLDLSVVAEGVETQVQIACLRSMGCESFQGFGFARPMRGEHVLPWLRKNQDTEALMRGHTRSRATAT